MRHKTLPGDIRMDFIDKIHELQSHAKKQVEHIQTEEATKTALVQPFINDILGYDIRSIEEVVPEYGANRGGKKDEKVDYAILKEGNPIILIECKCYGTDLNKEHIPQLATYFNFINAKDPKFAENPKFAILTDGIIYRFYTDLVKENVLDDEPFLEFSIKEIRDSTIAELKNFSKPYDPTAVKDRARELKYMGDIGRLIDREFKDPSPKFVKYFASQVHIGNVTDKVVSQFTKLTKKTLDQYIEDKINYRLDLAKTSEGSVITIHSPEQNIGSSKEKLEGFYIVKTLLKDLVSPNQIITNDSENSFDILLEGPSQRTICRLYLNDKRKSIGLFDENGKETMTSINSVDDIYKYSDQIASGIKPPGEKSFIFEGQTYKLELWKDMLPKVCAIMASRHKDGFEKVLEIKGSKYNFFSKNPDEFKHGEKIEGTDIYVDTNLGPWDQLARSKKIIAAFGLSKDAIQLGK